MEINKNIKEEFDARFKKLEDLIASRGLGSTQLNKAKKVQRNVNMAVFLGSLITVAGIAIWVLNKDDE